jgi:small-conductance mechanosensitive channel
MDIAASRVWLAPWLALLAAPLLALFLFEVGYRFLHRLWPQGQMPILWRVLQAARPPLRVTLVLLALIAALPAAQLNATFTQTASNLLSLAETIALGWSVTRMAAAAFDAQLDGEVPGDEDVGLRRRRTRLIVFRRMAIITGVGLTAALVLMAIPPVRAIGLSLFASAGILGIVIGIAARPAVSNLIAGLQLALTQPIRIGDAVTLDGSWGRVREITATYVTILTWDQRSLVVPLSYLLERPVTNWTKESARILDTVFLYLDHAAPVDAIRAQLDLILADTPLWDGRVARVAVTDARESCIEVRVLLSAADAPRMFDLRALVREKLLAWLVRQHPEALPRQRRTMVGPDAAG